MLGNVASSRRGPRRMLPRPDQTGVPLGCRIMPDEKPFKAPGFRAHLSPRCDYMGQPERFRAYSTASWPTGPKPTKEEAWALVLQWLVEAAAAGALVPRDASGDEPRGSKRRRTDGGK